ncbi:MAG: hypothetical protein ACRD22_22775, partial [Terriglobia bacterium]
SPGTPAQVRQLLTENEYFEGLVLSNLFCSNTGLTQSRCSENLPSCFSLPERLEMDLKCSENSAIA